MWLEEAEGERALTWAKQKSAASLELFQSDPRYAEFEQTALQIFEATDKIPYGDLSGNYVYNFWQDAKHVRGIWQRTTLDEYKKTDVHWDVLLDIDALAEQEGEDWVYRGACRLAPDDKRCLVHLSRGGKDAQVIREYDIVTRSFVPDGFHTPEAKQDMVWINENEVLVSTDFGPDTMTESGHPSMVKRWKRGQPLEEAELLMQVDRKDVGIWSGTHVRPEGNYTFLLRYMTFRTHEMFLLDQTGALQMVELPEDAAFHGFWNGHVLAILRSDWRDAIQGDVVALNMETDELAVLYHPNDRSCASYVAGTKDSLLIGTLENVATVLLELRLENGIWETTVLPFDKNSSVGLVSCDSFTGNSLAILSNFLTPSTLYLFGPDMEQPCALKHLPDRFNSSGVKVEQCWAVSSDGTQVPYFLVAKEGLIKNGDNPTLMVGYGGYEIPLVPGYNALLGKLWLENGGVYVAANIRGGGEFGPKWHQAALRENRHKAFEDFISIAEDLIRKQITTPRRLGIFGASNGGLLVGAVFAQRPDLTNSVICMAPVLDMLRYHKLPPGGAWVEEFGDPEEPRMHEFFKSYSPYENVFPNRTYPQVLFLTSTKDDRVHPGHARKMAAKMEDQGHKVFFYENSEGGHSVAADLKQSAKLEALQWVYLYKLLFDDAP